MIVEEAEDVTYGELADVELPDGSARPGRCWRPPRAGAGAVVRGAVWHSAVLFINLADHPVIERVSIPRGWR